MGRPVDKSVYKRSDRESEQNARPQRDIVVILTVDKNYVKRD